MEMDSQSHLAAVEEDYINMEITPYSSSSPQSMDFEFQPLSSRGELLPLPLLRRPPPFLSAPCTTSTTPSVSCRPSCDLTLNSTHFTDITLTTFFFNNNNSSNNPWSKMKKLNNRSYLSHKFKSSTSFIKSLFFTKQSSKPHHPSSRSRFGKKLISKNGVIDNHRRSFSGATASDSSSSTTPSSSSSSSSFNEVQFLRRRSSSSSAAETEVSIDAAIAHCKKSYAFN